MKKIILLFIIVILTSCSYRDKCQVNYSIIYPDTTIIYDTIFNYQYTEHRNYGGRDPHIPIVSSNRGTNYIRLGDDVLSCTTCPIRLNSYKKLDNDYDK